MPKVIHVGLAVGFALLLGVFASGHAAPAPVTRHVIGVVTDEADRPVAGASIDHLGNPMSQVLTDEGGRFTADTQASAVVIRKSGYKSSWVRIDGQREIGIRLERETEEARPLPTCEGSEPVKREKNYLLHMEIPMVPGIRVKDATDVDYSSRVYILKTSQGKKALVHGRGPTWSFGLPIDDDVWKSVRYEEKVSEFNGMLIVDARGQSADGNWWRNLGMFGETASYRDVDETAAKKFDSMLDRVCLSSSTTH